MIDAAFPALIAAERDGAVVPAPGTLRRDDLPPGELVVRVRYSSLNYKDALAATGRNRVAARYPHVPGIDAAGEVVESGSPALSPGTPVIVTGFELGAGRFGGFARYIRVPAGWAVPLPEGLGLRDAMALGTAGLTAALARFALERVGITPAHGPLAVSGASGGVGSLSVALCAAGGYEVVASTGKPEAAAWLSTLGAARIVTREEIAAGSGAAERPLLSARWGAAIDMVGGRTLDALIRSTRRGGAVTSCGLVGGHLFDGTVMPFILRGVSVLGIDSAFPPDEIRREMWRRLAGEWRIAALDAIAREAPLADVPALVESMLQGRITGRIVVSIP